MKILIDNQYKSIYDGEFSEWFETHIINVLATNENSIDYPKDLTEAQSLLEFNNEYDLVVISGYDSTILKYISDKKVKKVASVIYDMNAEWIINNIEDNGYLSDIITHKSRLIFLSTYVLCYSQHVLDDVKFIYSEYPEAKLETKGIVIDFTYQKHEISIGPRFVKNKYFLICESINGLTFLFDEFNFFINNLANSSDFPDNIHIIIISNNFPSKIWYKIKELKLNDKIHIYKNVSNEDFANLAHYALATLFLSPLDNNLNVLCKAIEAESICLVNSNNISMMSFYDELLNFNIEENDNFINDLIELLRISKQIKQEILLMQSLKLNELSNNKPKLLLK